MLGRLRSLVTHDLDFAAAWRWMARHPVVPILLLGATFRIVQWVWNRSAWMDESSLRANIIGLRYSGLLGPLSANQLAPPGFLLIEILARNVFGDSLRALRLYPLIGGLVSLMLFQRVAALCLRPAAALLALALVATADDLIYFSSELKQYSTDVAFALACTLGGLEAVARPESRHAPLALAASGSRRALVFAPIRLRARRRGHGPAGNGTPAARSP